MTGIVGRLISYRRYRIAREILALIGIEIHASTTIGSNFVVQHRGIGTVIHPDTRIGDEVTIYQQVTIGRADAHVPRAMSQMDYIEIRDHAVLYPGSRILGGPGITVVGRGTIIAANAVLTGSTGEWEVWAGVPARRISARSDRPSLPS